MLKSKVVSYYVILVQMSSVSCMIRNARLHDLLRFYDKSLTKADYDNLIIILMRIIILDSTGKFCQPHPCIKFTKKEQIENNEGGRDGC